MSEFKAERPNRSTNTVKEAKEIYSISITTEHRDTVQRSKGKEECSMRQLTMKIINFQKRRSPSYY